jgi:hypothetical protein
MERTVFRETLCDTPVASTNSRKLRHLGEAAGRGQPFRDSAVPA